jgi:hypothetical protein
MDTTSFRELKKTWYRKLYESGFTDIEYDKEHLTREAYMDLLTTKLKTMNVDAPKAHTRTVHRQIMELRACGWSAKEIATKCNRHIVSVIRTIGKYEKAWGLRVPNKRIRINPKGWKRNKRSK